MQVSFERTGARSYAVVIEVAGQPPRRMDPAPGYDDHIPHDLVHYVVEAELGLTDGVYGRADKGGGTFISTAVRDESTRERARQRRKQRRREQSLRAADERGERQMQASERLAALSDVMFRRRRGQRPDLTRKAPESATQEESAYVDRVVARLEALAQAWSALPVGGALAFVWPATEPRCDNFSPKER